VIRQAWVEHRRASLKCRERKSGEVKGKLEGDEQVREHEEGEREENVPLVQKTKRQWRSYEEEDDKKIVK